MPARETWQPSIEELLEPEEIVFSISSWHRLVTFCVCLYFVLCLAVAYFGYQTLFVDRAVIENWRVAYCQKYVELFDVKHPTQFDYLSEDLRECRMTSQKTTT